MNPKLVKLFTDKSKEEVKLTLSVERDMKNFKDTIEHRLKLLDHSKLRGFLMAMYICMKEQYGYDEMNELILSIEKKSGKDIFLGTFDPNYLKSL